MRIAYGLLAAGALIVGAASPASAGCYRDCDRYVDHPYVGAHYAAPYAPTVVSLPGCRAGHWPHGCRLHHHHGHYHPPHILYGTPHDYMGPVYASTGKYYDAPYVSHRAVFGYGGCRTAYLAYGPGWRLASNC
jgi:hypothetical protein